MPRHNQVKLFREDVDGHLQLLMLKIDFLGCVPDLFNCKHKPFISTVLINANRLLTYAAHSHG